MSRLFAFLVVCAPGAAHTALTINDAVQQALGRYPAVAVSAAQVAAASAGIQLARMAFLPRVDFHSQLNRATRNNVYGLLLPQSVVPPISGPPNPTNSMTNVWGSAVGLLVSWEPFDFGLRNAQIDAADVTRQRWERASDRTKFEVGTSAADAFLTIVAAEQTTETARAAVKRARVLSEVVNALVKAELRPGADASRASAELATAEAQVVLAEQAVATAKASLGQFLGRPPGELTVSAGRLLEAPPVADIPTGVNDAHPLLREQASLIEESKARRKILDRSYFPKFAFQASQYARGTGAQPDFTTGGAAAGLGPNIANWAAGISMTMPLMDYASLGIRKQVEAAQQRSESARYDQIKQDLTARTEKAKAMLTGASRVAAIVPVQLESARAAEQQATARYRAGLTTIVEIAEAQRLLTQAEIDAALARLQIWRALLAVAAAQGDLQPFLDQAVGK
jgi:outer membrane protein TolC